MADVTITIAGNAAIATRVMDAFAGLYGRPDEIPDPADPDTLIPNPETKAAFAKRMIAKYAKETTKAWEAQQASKVANDAAATAAESDISIT